MKFLKYVFLLLLVIDHATKQCSAIQINRDTMAAISVLGIGGKRVMVSRRDAHGNFQRAQCLPQSPDGFLGGGAVKKIAAEEQQLGPFLPRGLGYLAGNGQQGLA